MTLNLRTELGRYGAGKYTIKLLDSKDDTTLLRYVDLFPESATRKGAPVSSMPSGVVECDDRPLVYVYRANALAIGPDEDPVGRVNALTSRDIRAS